MLLPASAEFIDLCRTQVAMVVQSLGASASAVYLTEEFTAALQAQLIPIVVYPEDAESSRLQLPAPRSLPLEADSLADRDGLKSSPVPIPAHQSALTVEGSCSQPVQVVLPLMHEELVFGLLVVARENQQWNAWEQTQLERVAHTLAIACVLDQRQQWALSADFEQRSLHTQQYQTLSNLLHQFRNPLTTLHTLANLLLKRLVPADPNRRLANSMIHESDRLQTLLQQFDQSIDLGEAALEQAPDPTPGLKRLPAQKQPALLPPSSIGTTLQLQPCWIADVLNPLLDSAAAIAQSRQLKFQSHIPTDLPPVQADPQALREIFSNLIDNALKYTPAGQSVQVDLSRDPQLRQQAIAVQDTGPGIPAADLPHLFERYYRGVQSAGEISGTGLGLAIAQDLIQQMHGSLQVISPCDPKHLTHPGSRFVVCLPEVGKAEGGRQRAEV
jgi:signal transduction histidine kinase